MSSKTLQFRFDDMPLLISNGFECASVAGVADIQYNTNDTYDWTVSSVALDGYKRNRGMSGPSWIERLERIDGDQPIYALIQHTLDHAWESKVHDAVLEQIAEDRECERDNAADHRRDMRVSA